MADEEICWDEIGQFMEDHEDFIKRAHEKIYDRVRSLGGRIDKAMQQKLANCATDIRRMWDYDEIYDYLEMLPDGSPDAHIVARRDQPLFFPGYGPWQWEGFEEYALGRVRREFAAADDITQKTAESVEIVGQGESRLEESAKAVANGLGLPKSATTVGAGRIRFRLSRVWTYRAFYAFATNSDSAAAGYPNQNKASKAIDKCFDGDTSHDYDSIMVRFVPQLQIKRRKDRDDDAVPNQKSWPISKLVSVRKNHPLLRTTTPASAEELVEYDPLVVSGPSLLWILTEGMMKPSKVRHLLNEHHGVGMLQASDISNRWKAAVRKLDMNKGRHTMLFEAFLALKKRWTASTAEDDERGDSNIRTVQAFYDYYYKIGNVSRVYSLTVLGKEDMLVQTDGWTDGVELSEPEEEEGEEASDMDADMEE